MIIGLKTYISHVATEYVKLQKNRIQNGQKIDTETRLATKLKTLYLYYSQYLHTSFHS